jgi:hypothetical protein
MIPYVIQETPGAPIKLRLGGAEPLPLSDSQALFLVYQLTQALLGRDQAQARAK